MNNNDRRLGLVAAISGFLMVAGGAFGAHFLDGSVPAQDYSAFTKGMRYGLVHAVAALVALLYFQQGLAIARHAGWTFIAGIVMFSGSLAVIGLTGSRALVYFTPLGGLAFLAGWVLLFVAFLRQR